MKHLEDKLKSFESSRSPKSPFKVSRSINPDFPHISKFEDVTRYNSANYNVYFYKNYPNRQGTPIKAERKTKALGFRKSVSPIRQKVMELVENGTGVSANVKKTLVEQALQAKLRNDASPLKMVKAAPGPASATMNDFHKRETNAGYARNGSGGFYTR